MKKTIYLIIFLIGIFIISPGSSFFAQEDAFSFPFCTDKTQYCQKKVAQVPIPWQFWGIEIDPITGQTFVIDRIRISPTWQNPPPGQPPGQGQILVRRQFARVTEIEDPIPLSGLLWDFDNNQPAPRLDWMEVEDVPIEVSEGQDLELKIEVKESDKAVLVAYEVYDEAGEVVGHFINEAILESNSPQSIVQIMVNFDIHNDTDYEVTNFELDFLGLDFGCEDVRQALGFIVGTGETWGANPINPLVVRPIPGGTEVKWIQPDRPLKYCEWLHIGLVFDCSNFDCFNNPEDPDSAATVQGYWTEIEEKICDPRTQGYWKRICDGVENLKRLHPETYADFDPDLCGPLQAKGNNRKDPCLRAKAQYSALLLNVKYGYLSDCCEIYDFDGTLMTIPEAIEVVKDLLESGQCKEAGDLAESINSGYAL